MYKEDEGGNPDSSVSDDDDKKFIERNLTKHRMKGANAQKDLTAQMSDLHLGEPKNLIEMSKCIEQIHDHVNEKDNESLKAHIYVGEQFHLYQCIFKRLKKKSDGKTTWKSWLKNSVKTCGSYVYRHIQIYHLTAEYPGLRELSISFTRLFLMQGKIKSIFSRNPQLANEWKK